MDRSIFIKTAATLAFAAIAQGAVATGSAGIAGTIKGHIDGHAIDVRAICESDKKPFNFLQVKSDKVGMHKAIHDVDGDGIAVSVGASRAMRSAKVTAILAGKTYDFGGTNRTVRFTDDGFAIKSTIGVYEGKGRDAKRIGGYDVDLSVSCPGV